jgi:hypothetical protein
MKYHDTDCTQFGFCSANETRGYTVRHVITAVRWKETTLVTLECIWKRKPIPKSLYETHVSSLIYTYQDYVRICMMNDHISENLKYDHSSYRSFMFFLERTCTYQYKTCSYSPYLFFCILCLFLKFISPLVLKILMSVKYGYYGICVENSYRPFVSTLAWENTIWCK